MSATALVFCVHHKPWLMMSTLITLAAQEAPDADLFFIYNVGSGATAGAASNTQLSPFDERVRAVCQLRRARVVEIEYQNDEALDSGAGYKFIRDGHWKGYEQVVFIGEGTLLAHPRLLTSMFELTARHGAHLIASGHEQRRVAKDHFLHYVARAAGQTDIDQRHDETIARAFELFSRDPAFARLVDGWGSGFPLETRNHVPSGGPPSVALRRLRARWLGQFGAPSEGGVLAALPYTAEYLLARGRLSAPLPADDATAHDVFVNGVPTPADRISQVTRIRGVGFHKIAAPEYFGCATNHLMTRTFLERFSAKLAEFELYDVLDLPFAGTPLEVLWGFIPAWLGFDKWFTDGFHRVRKDFVTYRREDYPAEMATYINRYFPGRLAVTWHDDFLRIGAFRRGLDRLRTELPSIYFNHA